MRVDKLEISEIEKLMGLFFKNNVCMKLKYSMYLFYYISD